MIADEDVKCLVAHKCQKTCIFCIYIAPTAPKRIIRGGFRVPWGSMKGTAPLLFLGFSDKKIFVRPVKPLGGLTRYWVRLVGEAMGPPGP